MARDLVLAAVVTLVCGTAFLQGWFRFEFPGRDVVAATGIVLSVAVGPLILWYRGRQPLVPVAAIYIVVMLVALLFVHFNLAWRLGLVEF